MKSSRTAAEGNPAITYDLDTMYEMAKGREGHDKAKQLCSQAVRSSADHRAAKRAKEKKRKVNQLPAHRTPKLTLRLSGAVPFRTETRTLGG